MISPVICLMLAYMIWEQDKSDKELKARMNKVSDAQIKCMNEVLELQREMLKRMEE